jgi:hypothetical protein
VVLLKQQIYEAISIDEQIVKLEEERYSKVANSQVRKNVKDKILFYW